MNTIDFEKLRSYLTEEAEIAEINRLLQHQFSDRSKETTLQGLAADRRLKASYAPSIITRSEGELFELSDPRFALRIKVPPDGNGKLGAIINVRRLRAFMHQTYLGERIEVNSPIPTLIAVPALEQSHLSNRLSNCKCVADCLLSPPLNTPDGGCFVTAKLANVFGECDSVFQDVEWSAYLRHNAAYGGGCCAQAVCFMSSMLLIDYADQVYGMAEITFFATEEPWRFNELKISGLHYDEISRYFDSVGLRCWLQTASKQRAIDFAGRRAPDYYEDILRAYIVSGFPVICPVDCGRMQYTIYKNNGWHSDNIDATRNVYRHAVLVVGTSASSDNPKQFYFHDPSALPFMTATAAELTHVAPYKGGVDSPIEENPFMPVTPAQVKLPLGQWLSTEMITQAKKLQTNVEHLPGLIELQCEIYKFSPNGWPKLETDGTEFAYIRAIQANQVAKAVEEAKFAGLILDHDSIRLVEQVQLLVQLSGLSKDNWIWMIVGGATVWIWNAEYELMVEGSEYEPNRNITPGHVGVTHHLRLPRSARFGLPTALLGAVTRGNHGWASLLNE